MTQQDRWVAQFSQGSANGFVDPRRNSHGWHLLVSPESKASFDWIGIVVGDRLDR